MLRKMSKKCKILIFCMILVVTSVPAQQISMKGSVNKDFNKFYSLYFPAIRSPNYTNMPVPVNFYVKNLGFFCQQELKLEAITKIPFRFRLGSVNECDRMEGKGTAMRMQYMMR